MGDGNIILSPLARLVGISVLQSNEYFDLNEFYRIFVQLTMSSRNSSSLNEIWAGFLRRNSTHQMTVWQRLISSTVSLRKSVWRNNLIELISQTFLHTWSFGAKWKHGVNIPHPCQSLNWKTKFAWEPTMHTQEVAAPFGHIIDSATWLIRPHD